MHSPGTIAEACCCGLPIMLSSYLPGQESGNVGFVVDGGFGAYSGEPSTIASTVCGWLDDDDRLREMSELSLAASRPAATEQIADDIAALVHSTDAPAAAPPREMPSTTMTPLRWKQMLKAARKANAKRVSASFPVAGMPAAAAA